MSIRVMNWVWEHSRAKGNERLLLLAIADAADDNGRHAFPSMTTLAKKTLLSRRTVQRLIDQLETANLITVHRAGGRYSNRYAVLLTPAQTLTGAVETSSPASVDNRTANPQESHQLPAESTGGVNLTPRQSDTGDTATTLLGCHSYDTPGVTQLCPTTPPVPVLYPSTSTSALPTEPNRPVEPNHGGGGNAEPSPHRPNPDPSEPETEPASDAVAVGVVLDRLADRWRLGTQSAARLRGSVAQALAAGWTAEQLVEHLEANPHGVRSPYAVLAKRLADLPAPPAQPTRRPPWCGICHEPTRLRDTDTGAQRCPACHPAHAQTQHLNEFRRIS